MNKEQALKKIREAKQSHLSWVMKANSLIQGIPLEQDSAPVNGTDCAFGKWYYGEGQSLKSLPSFKAIEQHHANLHSCYAGIFRMLFTDHQDQGLIAKLFGQSAKREKEDFEKAKQMFPQLKKHSELVISYLDKLEKEVSELAD